MKQTVTKLVLGLSLAAAVVIPHTTSAQVPLSSGTYSQTFDTLATNGTANAWADNSVLPGWYASRLTSGPLFTQYRADNGSGNAGALYSYGATASTNRGFGLLVSSGTGASAFGLRFTNDTANAMINFVVSFTAEQWRTANSVGQTLAFSYQVGTVLTSADAANSQTWSPFSALNFSTPNNFATAAALDGTNPTNSMVFTNILLTGVSLQPGQELFLRWYLPRPSSGSSHGIAIDNLTVSFTATIPAPITAFIINQPTNQSVFLGDYASFSVSAGGDFPISYQWYSTNSSGVTLLTDQTNSTISLSYVTTNLAGGYFVAVTNAAGGTNSAVANLAVGARTPIVTTIAHLRTLMNPTTFAPTDITNLYTAQGIVTTRVNMTGSTNCQYYMQDGAAGITVFVSGGLSWLPAVGDRVKVTGPLGQFRGQFEFNMSALNPTHTNIIIATGQSLPTPVTFDLANVTNAAYMKSIESSLVVVSNVFMQTGSGYFVSGNTVNLTNLNAKVFPIFINSYVTDVVAQPIPAFASSITGVMAQFVSTGNVYTNGFQMVMTQYADLVSGTPPILPIPLVPQYLAGTLTLSWSDAAFGLESSTNVAGPYLPVDGAASPFPVDTTNSAMFFRLQHP